MTVRVAVWSGPRNISTAMMRSWGSRADCVVMDEPFYGAYLKTTGLDHPMAAETMAAHPTDWDAIAHDCATRADTPVVYQKHMAQHMIAEAPRDWMAACSHAFLIRPPEEVAASFYRGWPEMTADDLGFRQQAELFDRVAEREGKAPPVVEARDVLENPEGMLKALCAALGVPWDAAMLRWKAGPRETDGVWGAHWYDSVNRSTGFTRPRPPKAAPEVLAGIVAACEPFYVRLAEARLGPI